MSARRAAALLLGIPEDERKKIRLRSTRPTGKTSFVAFEALEFEAVLKNVLAGKNVALFRIGSNPDEQLGSLHLPLDWIATVWWEQLTNYWVVSTTAVIESDRGNYKAIMVWQQ